MKNKIKPGDIVTISKPYIPDWNGCSKSLGIVIGSLIDVQWQKQHKVKWLIFPEKFSRRLPFAYYEESELEVLT